jgi:hypothetical protein
VLVLVLTEVLGVVVVVVVGGVVVVVGGVVVVVGAVVDGVVSLAVSVSVTVAGGTADADVVVSGARGVVDVVSEPESPVMALASPNTTRAIRTAPMAPKATSEAGLRNHGVSGSAAGGWSYSPYP